VYLSTRMTEAQHPTRHNRDDILFVIDAFEARHLCVRCDEKKALLCSDYVLNLTLASTS